MNESQASERSPVLYQNTTMLAFIGDAEYETRIRLHVAAGGITHADRLHRMSARYVCAAAQASVINAVIEELPEDEKELVKRARNHKPKTKPKNADPMDYKWATAFEALLGYYRLTEQQRKIDEMTVRAIGIIDGAER